MGVASGGRESLVGESLVDSVGGGRAVVASSSGSGSSYCRGSQLRNTIRVVASSV